MPKYRNTFCCYYCNLPLEILSIEDVHFEHFHPKLQTPGNIVPACKWCDKFKQDRTPDNFRAMMLNKMLIEHDKLTLKGEKLKLNQFIPLVVIHSPWDESTNQNYKEKCLDEMIEIIRNDFKINIVFDPVTKKQVRWKYYELYRSKWLPPEIVDLSNRLNH